MTTHKKNGGEPAEISDGLRILVEFLNLDLSKPTPARLRHTVHLPLAGGQALFNNTRLRAAGRRLQDELKQDLDPVVGDTPDYGDQTAFRARLWRLIDKINTLGLKPTWHLEDYRDYQFLRGEIPNWPKRHPVRLSGTQWVVERRFLDARSLRTRLYGLIVAALEDGEFSHLKRCPVCKRFLVARDIRQRFCRARCRDSFYNERRNVKDSRQKRRRFELAKARKMLRAGSSLSDVKEATGLGARVLKKEGLVR